MFRRIITKTSNNESILADIRQLLASTLVIDLVYDQIAKIVSRIVSCDQLVITEIDANRDVHISHFSGLKVEHGNYGAPIALKSTLTDQVVQSRAPYLYQGRSRDQIAEEHPWLLPTHEDGINSWLTVPLINQDGVIGAIVVTSKVINAFTQQDAGLLIRVAAQISPMLANSRLYMELVKRNAELEALERVSTAMARAGTFQEKAQVIVNEIAQIGDFAWVTLRLPSENLDNLRLVAAAGTAVEQSPPMDLLTEKETMAFTAFHEGKILVSNDYASESNASQVIVDLGMKSMVFLPIIAENRTLGLVNVVSRELNNFPSDRVNLLSAFVEGIGALVAKAKLEEELQTRTEEMAVVDRVSRILTSTLNIDEVYEQFCEEVRKLVVFDRGSIAIFNEDKSVVTVAYLSEKTASIIGQGRSVPLEGTISAHVLETRRTMVLDNLEDHQGFWSSEHHLKDGLHSVIMAPLVSGETVYGTFSLFSRRANSFGEREQVIVERLAAQIAPAIENARLYEQLKSNAQELAVVDRESRILTSTLNVD